MYAGRAEGVWAVQVGVMLGVNTQLTFFSLPCSGWGRQPSAL